MALLGAIEGGGTKFVVAVADAAHPETVVARESFPTAYAAETMSQIQAFFDQYQDIVAIGISMFGPIDVNPLIQPVAHMVMCWQRPSVVGQGTTFWAP